MGHRGAWVGDRGEFGLPWCPHCLFPDVELLPFADGHGTVGEQRSLRGPGLTRWEVRALKQRTLNAKPISPSADTPPFPHIKQTNLGYYIPSLSGCSLPSGTSHSHRVKLEMPPVPSSLIVPQQHLPHVLPLMDTISSIQLQSLLGVGFKKNSNM